MGTLEACIHAHTGRPSEANAHACLVHPNAAHIGHSTRHDDVVCVGMRSYAHVQ